MATLSNYEDLKGKRYGKLTALEYAGSSKHGHALWHCTCDCGNETVVLAGNLKKGNTTSCGCVQLEAHKAARRTHGDSHGKSRLYTVWANMKQRCGNDKCSDYTHYGGRGISVCKEWTVYENFKKWALASGYSDNLTLDRINPNGNYEPNNCRFITIRAQQNNRTNNRMITCNGQTKTLAEWAETVGVNPSTVRTRLSRGWSAESALSEVI